MSKKWMKGLLPAFFAAVFLSAAAVYPAMAEEPQSEMSTETLSPEISRDQLQIFVGENVRLEVKNTEAAVKWSSASPALASVDSSGLVTGLKAGKTIVTAEVSGEKLTCIVTVENPQLSGVKSVLISGEQITLAVKGTSSPVKWSSSSPAVATVDASGKVKAASAGKTTITAQVRTKQLKTVISVESPKLNKTALTLVKSGKKGKLAVSGTTQEVTWSVSSQEIIRIDSEGTITAKKKGSAYAYADIHGIRLKCKVTVETPSLSDKSVVLNVGDVLELKMNGTSQTVKWKSAKKSVVRVSAEGSNGLTGALWGVKKGSTKVTATVGGAKFSCKVKVENPKISKSSAVLIKGADLKLKVKGTTGSIKWKSSNKKVAKVSSKGKVTAKKKGKATITATVRGKKLTCKIKVEDPKLSSTSLHLVKGNKTKLKISGTTQKIKWKTLDASIAKVYSSGKVKAAGKGNTKVYAVIGGIKFVCKVQVDSPEISDKTMEMDVGNTASLKLSGTTLPVTWKSNHPDIVKVTGDGENGRYGTLKALAKGKAKITATVSKRKYTCTVTVKQPITKLELSHKTLSLKVGESAVLSLTWEPKDTTDDTTATWSSSDTSVVSVKDGKVTAVAKGKATVKATVAGKTASCEVTVTSAEATLEEYYQEIRNYLKAHNNKTSTSVSENGITYEISISLNGQYIRFYYRRVGSSDSVLITLNTSETTYMKAKVTFSWQDREKSISVIGNASLNGKTISGPRDVAFNFTKTEGISASNALTFARTYLDGAMKMFNILLEKRTGVSMKKIGFEKYQF